MAKENLKQKEALQQEKINETVSKTEQFFNENKNLIYAGDFLYIQEIAEG